MIDLEFFRKLTLRPVFPMHAAAGDAMYSEFEKAWKSKVPGLSVAIPQKMGERFVLERH